MCNQLLNIRVSFQLYFNCHGYSRGTNAVLIEPISAYSFIVIAT